MRHIFIVNPVAGKENQIRLVEQIKQVFHTCDYEIVYTSNEKHASTLASQYARNCKEVCLYACGGDGTLNEVIQGMYMYKNACLGIIPIGTGNDFIKSLAPYAKDDFLCIENYLTPTFEKCDVLKVEKHVAINTASIGLDVAVAMNVDKFKNIPFLKGSMPYYMGLLNSLLSTLSQTYALRIDQQMIPTKEYTFIVGCNGSYYGGGYYPCLNASINDGYLDVCLIHKVSRKKILCLSNKYKKGTHIEARYQDIVSMHRCRSLQIFSNKMIPVNIDGEVVQLKDPIIEVLAKQITLCLPNKKIL